MRALHRKLIRDLASLRAQAVTTAILVICGVSLLIASWSAYRSLKGARDAYYRDYALADVFSDVKRAPLGVAGRIGRIPGVALAEPRIVVDGLVNLGEREPAVGRFVSVPSGGQPGLNRLYLRQGRLPSAEREIEVAVHEGFAQANGIRIGDRLEVLVQGRLEPVTVVGIALSPEYVYALSPAAPLPDDRHFGVIWMPRAPLERLARMADSFNNISVAADERALNRVKAAMDEALKPYGSRGAYGRDTQPSSQFVNDEILQQKGSAILMPAIFLSVAALLIQIIASRLVSMHRSQIATLKAVGYTDAEVSFHYLALIVCMMLLGAIPGIAAAAIVLVGALLYSVLVPRPVLVEVAAVERRTFHEVIRSDGILRSKERYIVPAFAVGDIRRVALKVGDAVKKGQAITELYWDIRYVPVKSPIDGVVSRVFRESAGPIQRGDPIVEVIDPKRLEVVAELLTNDATRVSVGDPAEIENWGGKFPLHAKVARVSQAGFTKQSALGVEEERTEVTMDLLEVPDAVLSRLGSTFHVDATIVISSIPRALTIPEGALFRDGPVWEVYTVRSGRASRKKVSVVARGGGLASVGDELREGESVVVYPGDLVRDGIRVRARQ